MKETRKDLGKRTGHLYFDELNPQKRCLFHLLNK